MNNPVRALRDFMAARHPDRVTITGRRPDLREYLTTKERFTCPPRFEWVGAFPDIYSSLAAGTCMEPILFAGDLLIIEPNHKPNPGELVAFYHAQDQASVVKRYMGQKPQGLWMVQDNPAGHFYMPPDTPMHRVIAIIPKAEIVFPGPVSPADSQSEFPPPDSR